MITFLARLTLSVYPVCFVMKDLADEVYLSFLHRHVNCAQILEVLSRKQMQEGKLPMDIAFGLCHCLLNIFTCYYLTSFLLIHLYFKSCNYYYYVNCLQCLDLCTKHMENDFMAKKKKKKKNLF